ncbi:MAG: ankyrin repeat domain-containing protein [Alphaproteobacteria bacterium]|nr:ankyrin repeat domain-containing protein [Alphaproteobacteria bacterium]
MNRLALYTICLLTSLAASDALAQQQEASAATPAQNNPQQATVVQAAPATEATAQPTANMAQPAENATPPAAAAQPAPAATASPESNVPAVEQPQFDTVAPVSSQSTQMPENVIVEDAENLLFKTENGEETVYNKKDKLFSGAIILPDKDNFSTTYYYKNGKKNGVAVSYYDNQQIRTETTYENGHKNGSEIMFAKDGNAIYQRNYKDDVLEGEEFLFHAGGKLRQRSFYVNGELNDKVHYFDPNGNLSKIETYQNGVKNGKEEVIENGRLREEYNYVDGKISGIVKKYNDKYLIEEIDYKDGLPEGIGKIYAEDGGVTEIPYTEGKRQGLSTAYYPDNKTKQKIQYINDQKNGVNETFYPNGQTSAFEYYKNDKLEGTARYFDEKGNLTAVKYYVDGNEMATVDLQTDELLKKIYAAYNSGKLSHYSTKRQYWFPVLWLALNTEKSDILQTLEKEMKMYVLAIDDMSVYRQEEDFEDISNRLYFGLTPLGYAINLAAPTEILQYFISQIAEPNPRGTTALQEAIRLNNAELVRYLLDNGADIELRDTNGNTALLYAVRSDAQPAIISALLQHGADINVKDNQGNMPISYALEQNHDSATILSLLNFGASLSNITLSNGETALFHALKSKQSVEVINSILSVLPFKKGETDAEGHSALYYALHHNYPAEIIDKIIELSGEDYNFEPADLLPELIDRQDTALLKRLHFPVRLTTEFAGETRSDLWYAYEHDAPQDMTDYLWEQGVNKFGTDYLTTAVDNNSLLFDALRKNDKFTVMHLIGAGALKDSPQKQDLVVYALTHRIDDTVTDAVIAEMEEADLNAVVADTKRPLWKELQVGRKFKLLRKLVTKFKNLPNLKDENGKTMVELASENPQDSGLAEFVATNAPAETILTQMLHGSNIEHLQFMLQKVGDVNQTDEDGKTLLLKAVEARAQPDKIEALIEAGADVNYATKTGNTAFLSACQTRQIETAQILVKHGADINAGVDGKSCLMSLGNGDPELLELLMQNNVDVTFKTSEGVTVLMDAVEDLNLLLIPYILEHQADVNAQNNDGDNVLAYLSMADKNRAEDIMKVLELLLKAGVDVNNQNSSGETALILFAKNNPDIYLQVRERLTEIGANAGIKDQYSKTADDYFAER